MGGCYACLDAGSVKVKALPVKCRKCAMLSAQQAKVLHGAEGDGCWNPSVCYSRRSYARNRDRINQTRSRRRKEGQLAAINVEFEPLTSIVFAVLVVYRAAGADTPVHAIAVEIWQGQEKIAIVPAVHCAGLVPSQVHQYMGKLLDVLEQRYGIRKFASQTRLNPDRCSLRPCPLHPTGAS